MTPHDIEVLIHHYVSPEPHPRIREAPGVQNAINMFVSDGILEPNPNSSGYTTTEKGKALMEILCNTEMPRKAWIDKDGNILTAK